MRTIKIKRHNIIFHLYQHTRSYRFLASKTNFPNFIDEFASHFPETLYFCFELKFVLESVTFLCLFLVRHMFWCNFNNTGPMRVVSTSALTHMNEKNLFEKLWELFWKISPFLKLNIFNILYFKFFIIKYWYQLRTDNHGYGYEYAVYGYWKIASVATWNIRH